MNGPLNKVARAVSGVAALTVGMMSLAQAADSGRYLVQYDIANKADVKAALSAGAVIHHEFDRAGIMAVSMDDADLAALAGLGSIIKGVSEDPTWELFAQDVPYGIDLAQARDVWDANRDGIVDAGAATGENLRVCVVDTGIYAAHEDLGGGGVNILGGKSFVGEAWDEDRQGHGTHVAGTIAAMNNDTGVVGVSPGTVDLLIADVFNDLGEGQASSTIFAGVEWCADNGADIISMSLGGPIGVPIDSPVPELGVVFDAVSYSEAYRDLYDQGILIIAAAGNDGDVRYNFPASYPSVVSVAAVDATETKAEFSNFNNQVEVAAAGVSVLSTYPFENSLNIDGGPSYKANAVAFSSTGDLAGSFYGPLADGGTCNDPVAPGTYTGNVVLCRRGDAAFQVKIDNAGAGGAVGVVIMNNIPGNVNATYGEEFVSSTPAISISQADGDDALTYVGTGGTMVVNLESIQGYAEVSGTSMATPHASGVAAVIWSACSDLTNDQVRAHLAGTTRSSVADATGDVRDINYGYGLVQTKAAVDALRDGVDEYATNTLGGNPDGINPSNAECYMPIDDGEDPTADGSQASGAGWLYGSSAEASNDKVNFNFQAEAAADGSGIDGKFQLKDKRRDVRIDVRSLDSFSELSSSCGPIAAGSNAIEVTGEGTFNYQPASFRLCASDAGEPGKNGDMLYLECTAGCGYSTTADGASSNLGGGNIKVAMQNAGTSEASSESAANADDPAIVALGPLLLDNVDAGSLQVLTATVISNALQPVAGEAVTLEIVNADGTMQTVDGTTGSNGDAVFTVMLATDAVEYRARAGQADSNSVTPRAR